MRNLFLTAANLVIVCTAASAQNSTDLGKTRLNECPSLGIGAVNCTCNSEAIDVLDGFDLLNPEMFLDLPDPDTVRATASIEQSLVSEMISNPSASITKTYCDIGIQSMVVDFSQLVEDDAVIAILKRAVFIWDSSGDPIGWRLERLGERLLCARGNDPFAPICP